MKTKKIKDRLLKISGVLFLLFSLDFLVPMFVGIVNIGTLAGFAACVLIGIMLFGHNVVERLFTAISAKKAGITVLIAAAALVNIALVYVLTLSGLMISAMNNKPQNPSAVIVLGCKVRGETPSLMLSRRIKAAEEFLRENPDVICVVSGGQGSDEIISEAEVMKKRLVSYGIDESRILTENKSTSTYENFVFSKALLAEKGVDGEIAVVSDGFHLFRASLIGEKVGVDMTSVPAKTPIYLLAPYWVREWAGLSAYAVGILQN